MAVATGVIVGCDGDPKLGARPGLHNDLALRRAFLREAACVGPVEIIATFAPSRLTEGDAAILKRQTGILDMANGELRATVSYQALRALTALRSVAFFPSHADPNSENEFTVPSMDGAPNTEQDLPVHIIVDLGGASKDAAQEIMRKLPADAVLGSELLTVSAQLVLRMKPSYVALLAEMPVVCAIHVNEEMQPMTTPNLLKHN